MFRISVPIIINLSRSYLKLLLVSLSDLIRLPLLLNGVADTLSSVTRYGEDTQRQTSLPSHN